MKKLLVWLMLVASASVTNAQTEQGKVSITVNIDSLGDSIIVYYQQKRDTILSTNGKFEFTLDAKNPANFLCATPASFRGSELRYFNYIAMPGESLVVTGSLPSNLTYSGSKFYQDYASIQKQNAEATKELSDYTQKMWARIEAGESRDSVLNEYNQNAGPLKEKAEANIMEVIKNNPDNEGAAYLISSFDNIEKMEAAINLLSDNVKNGMMKDIVYNPLNSLKAQMEADAKAAKVQAAGVEEQDFTLKDIKGKDFTLSSLKGKYVLLDFWGSWCVWCIKGMPKMKEYYDKYKDKMEIVGIDSGDTDEKWKEAVAKYELTWLHVKDVEGDQSVVQKYAVTGFPTKILIGPDGKIVKSVVGEDPQLYTFLDETFGSK